MTEPKFKFSVPVQFPVNKRVRTADLRALSFALVGSVFNAEIARLIVDDNNADILTLFHLTAAEWAQLPALNVHPDRISDNALRQQVQADSGWYRRYEDQYRIDHASEKDIKSWLLAVLPLDVFNKCVTAAGGEGLELRPAFNVRRILPLLLTALDEQKTTELKDVKAGMEKPFEPSTDTLETWLTTKTRLAARATEHLGYTFNDLDVMLSVWNGLAHLHLPAIATFKQAWTTTNRLANQRTFALLSAAILAWERDMVDSEQSVFEPTRTSAGYRATATTHAGAPSALQSLLSSTKITELAVEDSAVLARYVEAGLATIAHKKANPGFVIPPHACVTHGICYHTASECKSKSK
jgi:hypothetical protein